MVRRGPAMEHGAALRPHPVHRRRGDRDRQAGRLAGRHAAPRWRLHRRAARRAVAAASGARRRRCTGSTPTPAAACCSRARSRRGPAFSRYSRLARSKNIILRSWPGEISEEQGVIDVPLGKISSAEAGWRMVADKHGQRGTTNWRRLAVRDGSTLVEFRPLTGRTHQIRAHARMAFGRGILGDRVYGVPGGPMLLHAVAPGRPARGQGDDRRCRAGSGHFRRMARCGLRTWSCPKTR